MIVTQARAVLRAAIIAVRCGLRCPFSSAGSPCPDAEGGHLPWRHDPRRMLVDVPDAARDGSGPFVNSRSLIVGKAARLTLLPGHAIPFSGVSNRKLVSNGAEVKLSFRRAISSS